MIPQPPLVPAQTLGDFLEGDVEGQMRGFRLAVGLDNDPRGPDAP